MRYNLSTNNKDNSTLLKVFETGKEKIRFRRFNIRLKKIKKELKKVPFILVYNKQKKAVIIPKENYNHYLPSIKDNIYQDRFKLTLDNCILNFLPEFFYIDLDKINFKYGDILIIANNVLKPEKTENNQIRLYLRTIYI